MIGEDDDLPLDEPSEEGGETEVETPDAGKPQAVQRRLSKAQRQREEEQKFWIGVLGGPVGRRVLWSILSDLHAFEAVFACGPNGFPQPEATWFKAGEQAYGLRLYQSWLRLNRLGVALMHDENDGNFAKPRMRKKKDQDG